MQNFDFDKITPRRHTNSYKWDTTATGDDVIPMWVADMDFTTAPCIIDALRRRVDHGVFGYTAVPQEYYEAITAWFSRRHQWAIDPSHIIYTTGVVPALSAVIKGLTRPGDKVIVQTPAYNCFFSSIRNNHCELSENPLAYDPADGSYTMDFDDLELRASDPRATLMLLCNPHNPAGRVWTPGELRRVGEICRRHNVTVVSDEIHCELTYNGRDYTPYATVDATLGSKCVVCVSPSKAFNTAGLQIANIVCADPAMRAAIDRAINDNEVCDVNPFGVVGLMAAYNEGAPWLDALRAYLWDNYITARSFFETHLSRLTVTPLEGTYLMWVNISSTGIASDRLCAILEAEGHVRLSPGTIYQGHGRDFIRINLACPRSLLLEGLARIHKTLSTVRS